jgi:CHAT domain
MPVPHRGLRLIWAGRIAAVVILAGLSGYLVWAGLTTASAVGGSVSVVIALAALLAPYLSVVQPHSPAAAKPDSVEDSGAATATAGGQANTGVQDAGGSGPAKVARSGDARADGPGSTANTGIWHQPGPTPYPDTGTHGREVISLPPPPLSLPSLPEQQINTGTPSSPRPSLPLPAQPPNSRGLGAGAHDEDDSRPRYLTGLLPERAPAGARITLLAQITLAAPWWTSAAMEAFPVSPAGTTVTITVSAPGLIPVGDLEQDLAVPSSRDSRPVRFGFIAGPAGLHRVDVRAFIGGTCLAELALQISIEPGAALEEGSPRAALMAALAAEPGEVTLQVSRAAQGGYSFQLLSEALYPMVLIDRLAGDPRTVVAQMVAELRAMSRGQSPFVNPALVRNRLRSLGATLWADVVPKVIREQFWAQRDRIGLFTIASDIDTVPWELLYPVDLNNEDGFLVEQFPVVRRVYGQGRARTLRLNKGAGFIVPPKSPANAMDEVAGVRGILPADVIDRGTEAGLAQVINLLDAVPSVLHFAGHAAFTDDGGSLISLDGGPLRPGDLAYARQKRAFEAVSPLVFLNGCRTAGEIPGFTQMNGWAQEFMGAGAAAFIGSLWAVRSSSARTFAEEFYRALVHGRQALGAASLQARQAIAADEGDPTWLAYTVYGNPSASFENEPGPRLQPDTLP